MAAGEEEAVGPGAGYDAEKVREFFDQFDNDGSGNVSPEEFKELCQTMQPDMPDEDVAAALEQLDSDGDGEISFDGVCNHKIPFSSSMDLLLVHSLSGLFASVFECPLLVASGGQRTAIGGGDRAARLLGNEQRTFRRPDPCRHNITGCGWPYVQTATMLSVGFQRTSYVARPWANPREGRLEDTSSPLSIFQMHLMSAQRMRDHTQYVDRRLGSAYTLPSSEPDTM